MNIEMMKIKAEMLRVDAAKADMEVNIMEKTADIERLKKNMENQDKRLVELNEKLKKLQGE